MTIPIDPKKVEDTKKRIPSEELMEIVTELFKALGDLTRAKIVYILRKKTLCVRDISIVAGISESATSHQLAYLKERHLVQSEREGNTIYYSIGFKHISALLNEAEYYADHVKNNHPDHPYDQE